MSFKPDQYERFQTVLNAKVGHFVDCDRCPIKTECFAHSDNLTIEEAENQEPCEAVLLDYILTGNKPPT